MCSNCFEKPGCSGIQLNAASSRKRPLLLVADSGAAIPVSANRPGFVSSCGQLKPHLLQQACEAASIPLTLRMQDDYDHSYNFISTFV
jgi:S-formylglutathione hydrolase